MAFLMISLKVDVRKDCVNNKLALLTVLVMLAERPAIYSWSATRLQRARGGSRGLVSPPLQRFDASTSSTDQIPCSALIALQKGALNAKPCFVPPHKVPSHL